MIKSRFDLNRRRFILSMAAGMAASSLPPPPRLLAFGDSITVGDGATDHALGYARLVARRCGLVLDNRAVSGTKIADHQAAIEGSVFREGDTVLFLTGYNDMRVSTPLADYRTRLRACLSRPRMYVGNCLRMPAASYAIPPFNQGSDALVSAYNQIIAEEVQRASCFLVDASRTYDPERLCDDQVHPNDEGHALLARLFLEAMRRIVYVRLF